MDHLVDFRAVHGERLLDDEVILRMRSSHPDHLLLVGVLVIAAAFRVAAWILLPVAHDEVNVMAYGLSKAFMGGARAFLFDVPVTVSNGITPLWYWLQAIPAALFGVTSKAGLRTVPFLLGLFSAALAFRAAARIAGARAGWFSGLLMAAMSAMLYTNARGEFSESLIAPVMILLLLDLLPRQGVGGPPLRAALWPALILFTYAGKGLLVWGVYAGAVVAVFATTNRALEATSLARIALLILLPLLPSLTWLVAADSIVFGGGSPVLTDVGPVGSVWELIRVLTIGYGTEVKTFMVGSWRAALYPYTDLDVWPLLALVAVPGAIATGTLAIQALGARPNRSGRRDDVETRGRATTDDSRSSIVPLVLALPIFVLLVVKGTYSVRFHLLYLPVLVPYVGACLDRWLRAFEEMRWKPFLVSGAATSLYLAWAASWTSPLRGIHDTARLVLTTAIGWAALAAAVASGRLAVSPAIRGRLASAALTALILALASTHGVLHWGRRLAWEPELRETTPASLASLPNADLQLARFSLDRETWLETAKAGVQEGDLGGRERSRAAAVSRLGPMLRRILETRGDDGETLAEVGWALWRYSETDRMDVVARWRDHAARHPSDERIRRLLARAEAPPRE